MEALPRLRGEEWGPAGMGPRLRGDDGGVSRGRGVCPKVARTSHPPSFPRKRESIRAGGGNEALPRPRDQEREPAGMGPRLRGDDGDVPKGRGCAERLRALPIHHHSRESGNPFGQAGVNEALPRRRDQERRPAGMGPRLRGDDGGVSRGRGAERLRASPIHRHSRAGWNPFGPALPSAAPPPPPAESPQPAEQA